MKDLFHMDTAGAEGAGSWLVPSGMAGCIIPGSMGDFTGMVIMVHTDRWRAVWIYPEVVQGGDC